MHVELLDMASGTTRAKVEDYSAHELVECARKVLLVGISVLIDQGSYEQLVIGAAIAAAMLTVPAAQIPAARTLCADGPLRSPSPPCPPDHALACRCSRASRRTSSRRTICSACSAN